MAKLEVVTRVRFPDKNGAQTRVPKKFLRGFAEIGVTSNLAHNEFLALILSVGDKVGSSVPPDDLIDSMIVSLKKEGIKLSDWADLVSKGFVSPPRV